MPAYRFVILDGRGIVIGFEDFTAAGDVAALGHAKPSLPTGCDVEIWSGSRRVDGLQPGGLVRKRTSCG